MAKEQSPDTIASNTFWVTMFGAFLFISTVAVFIFFLG
jgi:hypothetical protein